MRENARRWRPTSRPRDCSRAPRARRARRGSSCSSSSQTTACSLEELRRAVARGPPGPAAGRARADGRRRPLHPRGGGGARGRGLRPAGEAVARARDAGPRRGREGLRRERRRGRQAGPVAARGPGHSGRRAAPGLARDRDEHVAARRRQPRPRAEGVREPRRHRARGGAALRGDRRGASGRSSRRRSSTCSSSTCASRSATTCSATARSTRESSPGARSRVAFADLVGFTKLGERLDPAELGQLTDRLGELAGDVARGPVRLVKLIGDAAMLSSTDPGELLDAALELVAASEDEGEGFPLLRAGVAFGRAVARAGDYYGRPVNLASRITAVARPGSVLCDEAMHDAAGEDAYRWSFAGAPAAQGDRSRGEALPRSPGRRAKRTDRARDVTRWRGERPLRPSHGTADDLRARRRRRHGAVALRAAGAAGRALGRRDRRAPPPAGRRHRARRLVHVRDGRAGLRDRRARPARRPRALARDRDARRVRHRRCSSRRWPTGSRRFVSRLVPGPGRAARRRLRLGLRPGRSASGWSTRPAPGRSSPA